MFLKEQVKVPTQDVKERLNQMVEFQTSVIACDKLIRCINGVKADLDAHSLTKGKVDTLPNNIVTFGERDIIDGINISLLSESEEVNRIWNSDCNFFTMVCRKLFGDHAVRNWTTLNHNQRKNLVDSALKGKDYEQIIADYGDNIVDDLCDFVSKHEWYVDVTAGYYDKIEEVANTDTDITTTTSVWLTADEMDYFSDTSGLGKTGHHECLYNFFVCFKHLESFRQALAEYDKRLKAHTSAIVELRQSVFDNCIFDTNVCKSTWINTNHYSNMLAQSVAELNKLIDKVGEEK